MYQAATFQTALPAGLLAEEICATPVGRAAPLHRLPPPVARKAGTPHLAGLVVTGIAHLLLIAAVLTAWNTREAAKPLVNVTTIVEEPAKPELLPPPPMPTMIKLPPPAELAMPRIELASPPPTAPPAPTAITAPPPATPVAVQGSGLPNFAGTLMSHLARHKRYPAEAREQRHEGVATIRFSMDRTGRVLSARLEKSSGFALLDQEALAILQRASPMPRIPDALTGDILELVIPIQFSLRQNGRRGD
jgi:protein TonB